MERLTEFNVSSRDFSLRAKVDPDELALKWGNKEKKADGGGQEDKQ